MLPDEPVLQNQPLSLLVSVSCTESFEVPQFGICCLPFHVLALLLTELLQCRQDVLLQNLHI